MALWASVFAYKERFFCVYGSEKWHFSVEKVWLIQILDLKKWQKSVKKNEIL